MNKNPIRCEVCGKFIKYSDIPEKTIVNYTPDTEYTIEKTEFFHKECWLKLTNINKTSLDGNM